MIRRLTSPVVVALSPLLIIPAGLAAAAPDVDDYVSTEATSICYQLDANPTFAGVTSIGGYLMDIAGFTAEQASEVVITSVQSECPEHRSLLRAYAEASTDRIRQINVDGTTR